MIAEIRGPQTIGTIVISVVVYAIWYGAKAIDRRRNRNLKKDDANSDDSSAKS
jgi:hypothetical protein